MYSKLDNYIYAPICLYIKALQCRVKLKNSSVDHGTLNWKAFLLIIFFLMLIKSNQIKLNSNNILLGVVIRKINILFHEIVNQSENNGKIHASFFSYLSIIPYASHFQMEHLYHCFYQTFKARGNQDTDKNKALSL